jgi:hypothetical protein
MVASVGRRDHARAEVLYARLLDVDRRVLGEPHPDTLMSVNSLGVVYCDQCSKNSWMCAGACSVRIIPTRPMPWRPWAE